MSSVNLDDYFYLGKFTKTVGYKGELAIYMDVDHPDDYFGLKSVMVLTKNSLVPYFFEWLQYRNGQHFKTKVQGIETEEQANSLVNCELYLPLTMLPKLEGNKFYFHEIIEFTVLDKTDGDIGKVIRAIDLPANPLLEVRSEAGVDILVPINDDVILKVNRDLKQIEVNLPEGLFDLYHS